MAPLQHGADALAHAPGGLDLHVPNLPTRPPGHLPHHNCRLGGDALDLQRVALQVQRLGAVRLRDASVADQHVS